MKEYIKKAIRTDVPDYLPVVERMDQKTTRLLHGAIGITTEAGELMDAMKKHLIYGKSIDYVNLGEEVGDICWYMALILDELGMSFEQVMEKNIAKLQKRYPEKFTERNAIDRDIDAERKILES